jgi:hypothetical protein
VHSVTHTLFIIFPNSPFYFYYFFFEKVSKESKMQGKLYCPVCEKKKAGQLCSRCHDRNFGAYCGRECQIKDWPSHKRLCYAIPKHLYENAENRVLREAMQYNLFSEYQGYQTRKKSGAHCSAYDEARNLIYSGVIAMIMADPVAGDKETEQSRADILAGCRLMRQVDPEVFCDTTDLLWLFVPQVLHSYIIARYDQTAQLVKK